MIRSFLHVIFYLIHISHVIMLNDSTVFTCFVLEWVTCHFYNTLYLFSCDFWRSYMSHMWFLIGSGGFFFFTTWFIYFPLIFWHVIHLHSHVIFTPHDSFIFRVISWHDSLFKRNIYTRWFMCSFFVQDPFFISDFSTHESFTFTCEFWRDSFSLTHLSGLMCFLCTSFIYLT